MPPRSPAVAGIFYPERKESLKDLLEQLVPSIREKQKAIAAILPHGSLYSSGAVAGAVYGRLTPSSAAVILGPNHSGIGERQSLSADGEWITPLGRVPVDRELARAILKAAPDLKKDPKAHQHEHSAELQLPFLQLWKIRGFVPLALSGVDVETARRIGAGLARAVRKSGREALLIASCNLACYEPQPEAERLDLRIIERILALDEKGFMDRSAESGASLCAAPAVAAVIAAAKELGGSRATLVKYEAGYAGILIQ